jgi:hypothetical protein
MSRTLSRLWCHDNFLICSPPTRCSAALSLPPTPLTTLKVRAKCVETIAKLIIDFPSKFLDNSYLKYVGWALYDKVADVRLKALEAIDNFYKAKLVDPLEAFTTRFKSVSLRLQ